MNLSQPPISAIALIKTPFIFILSFLKNGARQTYYAISRAYVFARTGSSSWMIPWKNVTFVGDLKNMKVGTNTHFDQDVVITCKNQSQLNIEDGVKVGSRCSISANLFSKLVIQKNTSFHSDCSLVGDIQIGRSCLFARNIFVSSFDHQFQQEPALSIKEQDKKYPPTSRPVVIDDDCWIGWGVAIRSGIHIGKGVVVGANSVVTKNLKPYRIYGGIPAKEIGIRLDFSPPQHLKAIHPEHHPYFYSQLSLKNQSFVTDSQKWTISSPILKPGSIEMKAVPSLKPSITLEAAHRPIQGHWKNEETISFTINTDDLDHINGTDSYVNLNFQSEQQIQIKEVIFPC